MQEVLRSLQWTECLVYLDDMTVYSKTFTETASRLSNVLQRLADADLKLKPSKYTLFATKVSFFGHASILGYPLKRERGCTSLP